MTEYAEDCLVWKDLHIPCDLLNPSLSFITMCMFGYGATDDLTIYFWGYLE
jgi:hypothetical protein